MNRERAKELLPIIEAYSNGETIQRYVLARKWEDVITGTPFDDDVDYRIKPKKPREYNICPSSCMIQYISGESQWTGDDGEWIKVREVLDEDL